MTIDLPRGNIIYAKEREFTCIKTSNINIGENVKHAVEEGFLVSGRLLDSSYPPDYFGNCARKAEPFTTFIYFHLNVELNG